MNGLTTSAKPDYGTVPREPTTTIVQSSADKKKAFRLKYRAMLYSKNMGRAVEKLKDVPVKKLDSMHKRTGSEKTTHMLDCMIAWKSGVI